MLLNRDIRNVFGSSSIHFVLNHIIHKHVKMTGEYLENLPKLFALNFTPFLCPAPGQLSLLTISVYTGERRSLSEYPPPRRHASQDNNLPAKNRSVVAKANSTEI